MVPEKRFGVYESQCAIEETGGATDEIEAITGRGRTGVLEFAPPIGAWNLCRLGHAIAQLRGIFDSQTATASDFRGRSVPVAPSSLVCCNLLQRYAHRFSSWHGHVRRDARTLDPSDAH